jgi:hypothetical protein
MGNIGAIKAYATKRQDRLIESVGPDELDEGFQPGLEGTSADHPDLLSG